MWISLYLTTCFIPAAASKRRTSDPPGGKHVFLPTLSQRGWCLFKAVLAAGCIVYSRERSAAGLGQRWETMRVWSCRYLWGMLQEGGISVRYTHTKTHICIYKYIQLHGNRSTNSCWFTVHHCGVCCCGCMQVEEWDCQRRWKPIRVVGAERKSVRIMKWY